MDRFIKLVSLIDPFFEDPFALIDSRMLPLRSKVEHDTLA